MGKLFFRLLLPTAGLLFFVAFWSVAPAAGEKTPQEPVVQSS